MWRLPLMISCAGHGCLLEPEPDVRIAVLFLLYDPITGRAQGTTSTFFATMAILPSGQVDVPHRPTSSAINDYFQGRGWSIVGGRRYEWESGDLMLSAPGWMPHGHAADEEVLALIIQHSPLQISLGSLWMENLKDNVTAAMGVTKGFGNSTSQPRPVPAGSS
jgi:gentisate 1,2-dioxygenase